MPTAKELRDELGALYTKVDEYAAKANSDEGFSAEDRANWDALNDDLNAKLAVYRDIQKVEKAQATRSELEAERRDFADRLRGEDTGKAKDEPEQRGNRISEETTADAFNYWMRSQFGEEADDPAVAERERQAAERCRVNHNATSARFHFGTGRVRSGRGRELAKESLTALEHRAQATSPLSAGGALVPVSFQWELERAMLAYGSTMNVSRVLRTPTSEPIHWPTINDTSNKGSLIGENQAVSTTSMVFWDREIGAFKITSDMLPVSHELLRNSMIDLGSLVGELLGERIMRKAEELFTTGIGKPNQPQGFTTAAATGKTTASATAITYGEIVDLKHSVDPAYRNGAIFMCHDSIAAYVRKLQATGGEPIWQWDLGLTEGNPERILGHQLVINQEMDSAVTASKKTMAFGDFSKFMIRIVENLRLKRLVERYAEYDQEGFVAFLEVDSFLMNAGTNPIKLLVQNS